jgi:hypothetical protein
LTADSYGADVDWRTLLARSLLLAAALLCLTSLLKLNETCGIEGCDFTRGVPLRFSYKMSDVATTQFYPANFAVDAAFWLAISLLAVWGVERCEGNAR